MQQLFPWLLSFNKQTHSFDLLSTDIVNLNAHPSDAKSIILKYHYFDFKIKEMPTWMPVVGDREWTMSSSEGEYDSEKI